MFARTQSPNHLDYMSAVIKTLPQAFIILTPQTRKKIRCSILIWTLIVPLSTDLLTVCPSVIHIDKLKLGDDV